MPFKVKITNGDEIIIDDGNTILESALDQGIDFPHGCRTGNCGACKSKKISGEIEMSPFSEFALDEHYNPSIYPEVNTTITDLTTLYKVSEVWKNKFRRYFTVVVLKGFSW